MKFLASRSAYLLSMVALLVLRIIPCQAQSEVFQTSDGELVAGQRNQGHTDGTVNHKGNYETGAFERDFFSFDLTSLDLQGKAIVSATLGLSTATIQGDGQFSLFDVDTNALTLNHPSNTNSGIYNDLGSGTSYGSFLVVTGDSNTVKSFSLSSSAFADIVSHAGKSGTDGYFSIGGTYSLPNLRAFTGSGDTGTQSLTIVTATITPEGASINLAVAGLLPIVCFGLWRRSKTRID